MSSPLDDWQPSEPHIWYKCDDGSTTNARTPSLALIYWHGRNLPQEPLPEPIEVCKVYVGKPVPGPYHPALLTLVIAACERRWNQAPDMNLLAEIRNIEKAQKAGECPEGVGSFDRVVEYLQEGHPFVVRYEWACLDILRWLRDHGDIVELEVALDMPPRPSV